MSNAILVTKIGALILFLQNLIWVLGFGITSLFQIALYVDLIGFLLLGIGYFLYGTEDSENKNVLFLVGGSMLIWVVSRVYWQFVAIGDLGALISGSTTDPTAWLSNLVATFQAMVYAFLLSGVVVLIGSFLAYRIHKGRGTLSFFIFGIVNFVGVFMLTYPIIFGDISNFASAAVFGFFLKALIVPVIGLVAFLLLFLQYNKVEA